MSTISLKPVGRRLALPPLWATAILAVWLSVVGVYGFLNGGDSMGGTLCHLRRLTDLPCPTCGTTRLGLAVLQGDFLGAFLYNPLVFVALLAGVAWLALRLGLGRAMHVVLSRRAKSCLWILLSALFLLNWAYVVWRHVSA